MIELKDVGITFHEGTPDENTALKNINLKINQGDFITVIGSNGAGKSTLYNIIAGTLTPTVGHIYLDEKKEDGTESQKEITNDAEYKRASYIGRIFQNPLLGTAGKMSLEDNMIICSKKGWHGLRISLNKKKREEFREQLKQLEMGLEDRLNDNVELLSGGQRQALTLLMAVLSKPALLLLDEHTAALDPSNAALIMNLTKRFAKEYNLTVMMITHNMQQALDYGNRLLMMDGGEIIMDISGEEKQHLTLEDLADRFRAIKKQSLTNDNIVLQ
ncbi:MAG: ATP-binding cassette domain-containing protein [Treponemataceae bacterium]|nr:ATP-binding cassette domain-containing protein [Treponemataceae bacterium]